MATIASKALWKARELFDMFFAPLNSTHYLELVNPLWNYRSLQARVEEVTDETANCRTITLRPGRGWHKHKAGQHIRLGVAIGGVRHTRTYSISSSPDRPDGLITITVKRTENGRVSEYLNRNLEIGTFLQIGLPQGDFVIPDAVPVRALFITGGSGITPIMSMLRGFAGQSGLPDIYHMHFSHHAFDVIFGQELRQLAVDHTRYKQLLIYTAEVETGGSRHFSAELLEQFCPDWQKRGVWVCGPQALMDAVAAHWQSAGLGSQVHFERFHAAIAPLPADAKGGNVSFARSQKTVQASGGRNLLQLAEDSGLNPAHGCRMGICHGCNVKLLAGNIRDLRTGKLVHYEPGQKVRICISAAAGDLELDI